MQILILYANTSTFWLLDSASCIEKPLYSTNTVPILSFYFYILLIFHSLKDLWFILERG